MFFLYIERHLILTIYTVCVGYAMGSLIGGVLYHEVGGKLALIIFCAMSLLCCLVHFVLYECLLKHVMLPAGT